MNNFLSSARVSLRVECILGIGNEYLQSEFDTSGNGRVRSGPSMNGVN
jgi:hypothetical protein